MGGGGQIAGLLKSGILTERPYALLLGTSTLTAVNPSVLERDVDPPAHWLPLISFGTTTCELEFIARLAFKNGIRPMTLVLGLQLSALARSDEYLSIEQVWDDVVEVDYDRIVGDVRSGKLTAAASGIVKVISNAFAYCVPSRLRFNQRLRTQFDWARIRVLEACGQGALAAFATRPLWEVDGPWRPPADFDATEAVRGLRARGAFDAASYSVERPTSRSLVQTTRLAQATGTNVVVIIMPESSALRAIMPANAMQVVQRLLTVELGANPPKIINARGALPDDLLWDCFHATPEGSRILTQLVARELNRR